MTTDTTSTVPVHTTPGQPETRQESGSLTAAATSPSDAPEVIRTARAAGIGSPPGAYTPTEIVSAWRHGPGYLADIAAPLPHIPLVPTGGVHAEDIAAYHDAGALAVGMSR